MTTRRPLQAEHSVRSFQMIGKKIKAYSEDFSNPGKEMALKREVINQTRRQAGVKLQNVEIKQEADDNEKIVIVPQFPLIETGEDNATDPNHGYPWSEVYLAAAAKKLEDDFGGGSDAALGAEVRRMAGRALTEKQFHDYRLGEYCVSQCW